MEGTDPQFHMALDPVLHQHRLIQFWLCKVRKIPHSKAPPISQFQAGLIAFLLTLSGDLPIESQMVGMVTLIQLISLCILIGLDLKISVMRWKQGYRDLNPVVQHFVKSSPTVGALALLATNLLVTAAAFLYQPLVWMLIGGKLALASLQLRSLYESR